MDLSVLIVDDVDAARKITRRLLNKLSITATHEAKSAEEALAKISSEQIDLVICDINLGGMSGIDLLAHLKSDPISEDLFMLLITSDISAVDLPKVKQYGLSYILKPFNVDSLKQKLEELMEIEL